MRPDIAQAGKPNAVYFALGRAESQFLRFVFASRQGCEKVSPACGMKRRVVQRRATPGQIPQRKSASRRDASARMGERTGAESARIPPGCDSFPYLDPGWKAANDA